MAALGPKTAIPLSAVQHRPAGPSGSVLVIKSYRRAYGGRTRTEMLGPGRLALFLSAHGSDTCVLGWKELCFKLSKVD